MEVFNDMINNYITTDKYHITYATLFCNGNWLDFIYFLQTYEKGIYVITPGKLETSVLNIKGRYS